MKEQCREMVFDRSIGKLRPIGQSPLLSSASLNWRGFRFEQHEREPFDTDVLWINHVVILHLGDPLLVELKEGGRFVAKQILPDQFCLRPAQSNTAIRSREKSQFLVVSLDPTFMSMACCELSGTNELELRTENGIHDRFIAGVCWALKEEVEKGGASGRLYSESVATSLAVHLARKYSLQDEPRLGEPKGLPPRTVRRAIEFIHARLTEDITVTEMAAAVGLSPFHFARLFKQAVGVSPYQFVLRQRIERAKQLIIAGSASLAEIAIEVGFFDQSHFTQHFKRLCGLTPKSFAEGCGLRKSAT